MTDSSEAKDGAGVDPASASAQDRTTDAFKHEIAFHPAYDKRDPDPMKNYGIHGVECVFTVSKNGKGVTFMLFTNWMLPHVQAETDAREPGHGSVRYMFHKPQPAGVDYHSPVQQYEGQHSREHCTVTGGKCFSDGSGLLADDYFNTLLHEGSEGVFKRLERQYVEWMGDDPSPSGPTPDEQGTAS